MIYIYARYITDDTNYRNDGGLFTIGPDRPRTDVAYPGLECTSNNTHTVR